jgi:phosphohistidine phosphatase SixA
MMCFIMLAEAPQGPERPGRMGKLAIVRHGKDDPETEVLTPEGRQGVLSLGERLADIAGQNQVNLILTSTAPRALQTAELLAEQLGGAAVVGEERLWRDNTHPRAGSYELIGLIQDAGERADFVVLVTHLPNVVELPDALRGVHPYIKHYDGERPGNAQGLLIDFATGDIRRI